MRKFAWAVVILLTLPTFGDGIDEAEAKRRGVSVERVQLDHAQETIKSLQAKVEALTKQLGEMKAAAEKQAQDTKNTLATKEAEIAELKRSIPPVAPTVAQAIKDHTLMNGMTLEQAKTAIEPARVDLVAENDGVQVYRFQKDYMGQGTSTTAYWNVEVSGNKVISWTRAGGSSRSTAVRAEEVYR